MTTAHHHPSCPQCGYDMAGLFQARAAACCPECNRSTSHSVATQRLSRWVFVLTCLLYLLCIPVMATILCWGLYFANFGRNLTWIFTIVIWTQMMYIPAATYFFIQKENAYRRHALRGRTHPSKLIVVSLAIAFSSLSLIIFVASMIEWKLSLFT
ncbi:MAG: hypothetical protein JKX70_01120 [Phycisphaerales bacterium]|nr:hypothetical protein [Phycisphaerales bacterium]